MSVLFVALVAAAVVASIPRSFAQAVGTSAQTDAAGFEIPDGDDQLPGQGPLHRADWFRSLWRERRSGWAERVERDAQSLVFLGDSITQGWGDALGEAFPGVKVANRGISGDTTRGVLYRLHEDVLALRPRGVVLMIGTNDIGLGASPELIAGNMKAILDAIEQHDPRMPVVLCLVFPAAAEKDRPADRIRALNRIYGELAREYPQVTVLDTWTLYANQQGDARPEEFPDLLHPNAAGYAKWAAALRPVLATLEFLETDPDDFEIELGFENLFNGRDLSGWGLRPTTAEDRRTIENWRRSDPNAPPWPIVTQAVSFDGKASSTDGRYVARSGRLVVTTPVEGRRIQQLWTTREFPKNFTLKLEFRATPNADSGIFVRGRQLQCRDYLLAGPYKELQHYKPQEWNEIVIQVRGNTAHCTCNGELLEAEFQVPSSGPIGLEGDRGQMEYRRIRVREEP
jgi:lysophospholipase L1-like esterase